MPTGRFGCIRHLLKDGKAKIVQYHPFTIQLLYASTEFVQPLELSVDSGSIYVGVSLKTEKKNDILLNMIFLQMRRIIMILVEHTEERGVIVCVTVLRVLIIVSHQSPKAG